MLNFLVGLLTAIMFILAIGLVIALIEKGYYKVKKLLGRYLPIEKIIEVIQITFIIAVLSFVIYLFSWMLYDLGKVILQNIQGGLKC